MIVFTLFRSSKSIYRPNFIKYLNLRLRYNFRFGKDKRPPYWNFTSGFDVDYITVIGMLSCLSVPNCIKIGWPTAKLWRHTYFQDGGRGRSILFPVSYLLMSLPSKQISSTRLNSRLRTHYMCRNVSLSSLKSRKFRIFGKNLPIREKRFFHTPLHSTPR